MSIPNSDPFLEHFDALSHQIETSLDGGTLWVTASDGSCIGRFSKRFGIDLHTTAEAQMRGEPQCLYCTHEAATQDQWKVFRTKMMEIYGIAVPEDAISW